MHNHSVVEPGHAARERNACRVLGDSSRRWNEKPSLRALDFAYSNLESPAPAAVHSVRWPESVLFLPTPCQLFEISLSQLTSGAGFQRDYEWEYASLDIVPLTNTVRLVRYNLQQMHIV